MTKVFAKVNYETALDSDPRRTQVVPRNHAVKQFPLDNGLPIAIQLREAVRR